MSPLVNELTTLVQSVAPSTTPSAFIGGTSAWHWLILAAVVLVLFGGRGKIPALMKDMGKGITAFKKGLKDDSDDDSKVALEDSADVKTKEAEKS